MQRSELVFLKLGGSLITDKSQPQVERAEVLERLGREVASALALRPETQLIIGHGAGSFGHMEAKKYATRNGVSTQTAWRGFAEVAEVVARLRQRVLHALRAAGVPAIALPPSASAVVVDSRLSSLAIEPLRQALAGGLVPLIHGDVAFDSQRGGAIISTEDCFEFLALRLRPQAILLAGIEDGVVEGYPGGELIAEISPQNFEQVQSALSGSAHPDVTGGMASKVRTMVALAEKLPGLEIQIFSGAKPEAVKNALLGASKAGTRIYVPA